MGAEESVPAQAPAVALNPESDHPATTAPGIATASAADPDPARTPAGLPPAEAWVSPSPARASRIVLAARADAWLMVRDEDGRTLLARILRDGESWKVPNLPGLRLSTGNAGATAITIDGVLAPTLGASGAVRRDIPLDARLLAASSPPTQPSPNARRSTGARSVSLDGTGSDQQSATASR